MKPITLHITSTDLSVASVEKPRTRVIRVSSRDVPFAQRLAARQPNKYRLGRAS